MKLRIEEVTESPNILFVYTKRHPIIYVLNKKIKEYGFNVISSRQISSKYIHSKYVFIFDDDRQIEAFLDNPFRKSQTAIILFSRKKKLEKLSKEIGGRKSNNIKIINLDFLDGDEKTADKILWFMFSETSEQILNLERFISRKPIKLPRKFTFSPASSKKKIFFILFLALFFLEFFFIFPLLGTIFLVYRGFTAISSYNLTEAKGLLAVSKPLLSISNRSYQISRPVLSFLSLNLIPDNMLSFTKNGYSFIEDSINISENGQKVITLILKNDKSSGEQKEAELRIQQLKYEVRKLTDDLDATSENLNFKIKRFENLKLKLLKTKEALAQAEKMLSHIDSLIGGNEEKKYLILFQNNMEIRPGGGFIGSIGIATFSNYTLKDFSVEDVYQADGQLKEHLDPPEAIRKYLNQPNWFLRDSNFAADFSTNFKQASIFLDKELGIKNFKGGAAITTTAINNIIKSFGEIYLPDYNENVNSDNFYIKAQTYSEKDFFPGSTSKKNFLSSVVSALTLKLGDAPFKDLATALKKSLDEKQIVLYLKDDAIEKDINSFGWGGKVINPTCASEITNCIPDSFFPIDANLGVNKANFFLSRHIDFESHVYESGEIKNTLNITFKNESDKNSFPGGIYKNYFQIFFPAKISIQEVTINNTLTKKYEEKEVGEFKYFSHYIEVPPESSLKFTIKYTLGNKIQKGKNTYQLIVQKQIGALNNDLSLEFTFPPNIRLLNPLFPALAKRNGLIYNTSLSTDRIFFIELLKE